GTVRPGAVVLGQRLALLGSAGDRRRRAVGGRGWHDDRRGGGGRRSARAVGVAGRLLHPDRVADICRRDFVGLFGGAVDRRAVVAGAVALVPLVGVARGFVRPAPVLLGERLALLGGAGDRGRAGRDGRVYVRPIQRGLLAVDCHGAKRVRGAGAVAVEVGIARAGDAVVAEAGDC